MKHPTSHAGLSMCASDPGNPAIFSFHFFCGKLDQQKGSSSQSMKGRGCSSKTDLN